MMRIAWVVFCKELVDALRDRRTLFVVLLSSVALGPVMLTLMARLVSDIEQDLQRQEVHAIGGAHAPTLVNYLQRQGMAVRAAAPGDERALAAGDLGYPLLRIPPDFEQDLAAGRTPRLVLLTHGGQRRVDAAASGLQRRLQGFNQEQATLRLALRGVAPGTLQAVQVDEQDEAPAQQRGAEVTRMLPFFMVMAVLYGALAAALDATAGERERQSLEPLVSTAAPAGALVLGKWGAVAVVGMLVAVLACLGFLAGPWLLRGNARLAAGFHFGPEQALTFLGLLLPMAGLMSAMLMAVAIRCRTHKEAQASTTVLVLVASLLPMVHLMGSSAGSEAGWQRWVPVLWQSTLMQRVLGGGSLSAMDGLVPLLVALVGTGLCLVAVARTLRRGVWS